MYVNAFWFGFLMAIVAMIVLSIIMAIVKSKNDDDEWEEYQPTDEELKAAIEAITGKKYQIIVKDGIMYGEEINDKEEDDLK